MSILIVIFVFSLLIIVHEFGHFLAAKRTGVKVERFSLGLGPRLIGVNFKDTDYCISLIPLGGYVKMAGDNLQEYKGEPFEYFSRTPGERARIIFFGPLLNYVLAFLCFWLINFVGYPVLLSKVGKLLDEYPARAAGIMEGDKIIRINGEKVEFWDEMQEKIQQNKEGSIEITIERQAQEIKFNLTPKIQKVKNMFGQEQSLRLIGVAPSGETKLVRYGVFRAFWLALTRLIALTIIYCQALWFIITGAVSFKESITGPLGIFYITSKAAAMGLIALLHVVAILNLSLAVINLLPLPVLDGGHLLFLGIEKIRKKRLSVRIEETIDRVGVSFLVLLALFVFYNDFIKFGVIEKAVNLWSKIIGG